MAKREKTGMQKKHNQHWKRNDTELTILALPTIIWYILFSFLPMFGVIIAFKDFKIHGGFLTSLIKSDWVGLKNFQFMITNNDVWIAIRNTIGYNIVFIILNIVLPVALALLVGQLTNVRASKSYQTAMFLPYFLSWVVVSALVWAFLSFDKGMINGIIKSNGGQAINWYMEKKYWPFLLVFLNVWKGLGYSMVVYLATITGIDTTYYEAAMIDGATKWQQMRFITLPIMRTVIVLMFIMAMGRVFYSDFGLFYQVPRDSNSLFSVTYTIDVMVYKSLKSGTVGMTSAAAFLQSALGCLTILGTNAIVRKLDSESAMI